MVEFVIVLKMSGKDEGVLRIDEATPEALYAGVRALVNENFFDSRFPGEAGDWFADHVCGPAGYYKSMMAGRQPACEIEDEENDVSVTVYRIAA